MGRKITQYFIIISILLWLFYDGYVIIKYGKDASISQVMIDYSYNYPIGVFLLGILAGHLFWRMPNKKKELDNVKDKK